MKINLLTRLLLSLQALFFLFVLFTAPNPVGHLRLAVEAAKAGSSATIVERINTAIGGYEFQTTITMFVSIGSMILIGLILFVLRRNEKSA